MVPLLLSSALGVRTKASRVEMGSASYSRKKGVGKKERFAEEHHCFSLFLSEGLRPTDPVL